MYFQKYFQKHCIITIITCHYLSHLKCYTVFEIIHAYNNYSLKHENHSLKHAKLKINMSSNDFKN